MPFGGASPSDLKRLHDCTRPLSVGSLINLRRLEDFSTLLRKLFRTSSRDFSEDRHSGPSVTTSVLEPLTTCCKDHLSRLPFRPPPVTSFAQHEGPKATTATRMATCMGGASVGPIPVTVDTFDTRQKQEDPKATAVARMATLPTSCRVAKLARSCEPLAVRTLHAHKRQRFFVTSWAFGPQPGKKGSPSGEHSGKCRNNSLLNLKTREMTQSSRRCFRIAVSGNS